MGEQEIDLAIKMFQENAENVDPKEDAFHHNLNGGLLAMARAVKEIQQQMRKKSSN